MSRIQQILDKAAREGRVSRTADLGAAPPHDPAPVPVNEAPPTSAAAATPHVRRRSLAEALPARPEGTVRAADTAPVDTPRVVTMPSAAPSDVAHSRSSIANPVVAPSRVAPDVVPHPLLVAATMPDSPVAEQYRGLRTRISQVEQGRHFRALLVTSPGTGDGKTITSVNLAFTMAREPHRQVLMLDADLRHGSVHRLLGLPRAPGLSDVLAGQATLEEALISLPSWRLTVLTAGSHVESATELLGSAEMRRVLDTLRSQFDRLVIDSPPALAVSDVGVVAPLMDAVLVVVRAGQTTRPAIERTLGGIDPSRLLGLVLNDVEDTLPAYAGPAQISRRDGRSGEALRS